MPESYSDKNKIEIDRIMEKIREEVQRRRGGTYKSSHHDEPVRNEKTVIDDSKIKSIISSAESNADIGLKAPMMLQFQGLTRRLAVFVGKKILYVSTFITTKQRYFNTSVIHALKTITDNLSRLGNDIFLRVKNETDDKIESLKKDIGSINTRQAELNSTIEGLKREQAETISYLEGFKNEQYAQLEEIGKDIGQIKNIVNNDDGSLEDLYVSFEVRFRGSREDIKERVKKYLPYIKEVNAGTNDLPVLDIGCGRGEWLELLKDEGLIARGVDKNSILTSQCGKLDLDVTNEEMLLYLKKLPDKSLGAVTGFHIIEHLPFVQLIKLLDETIRVLNVGGVAIFETPNPQNVIVGSNSFYLDPTHRKPLPNEMMKFLSEARGLSDIKILDLHPFPDTLRLQGSELAGRFNNFFYGSRDYAVIGYKK
jgi:O-antigen chain-terminating methyltransferase